MNLLLRFWDPQEGRVLYDGRDLRELEIASFRGQIGLVFRTPNFLFDTTLRENIALAREGATDAEVLKRPGQPGWRAGSIRSRPARTPCSASAACT